jgi:hypothetical protein
VTKAPGEILYRYDIRPPVATFRDVLHGHPETSSHDREGFATGSWRGELATVRTVRLIPQKVGPAVHADVTILAVQSANREIGVPGVAVAREVA